jgi:hypothetical protein
MNTTGLYNALLQRLHLGAEVNITIRKQDGTLRDMLCAWGTLGENFGEYARVWDVEHNGYRTIRREALVEILS